MLQGLRPDLQLFALQVEVTEDERRKRPIVRVAESPERIPVVEVCLPDSRPTLSRTRLRSPCVLTWIPMHPAHCSPCKPQVGLCLAGAGLRLVAVGVSLGIVTTVSALVLHAHRHAAAGHGTTMPAMETCRASVMSRHGGPVAGLGCSPLQPQPLARQWSQWGPLAGLGASPRQPRPLALPGR